MCIELIHRRHSAGVCIELIHRRHSAGMYIELIHRRHSAGVCIELIHRRHSAGVCIELIHRRHSAGMYRVNTGSGPVELYIITARHWSFSAEMTDQYSFSLGHYFYYKCTVTLCC